LQNSYFALGLTIEVNDAENDVYYVKQDFELTIKKTSLHDEIDIKAISIEGQNVNLTFYGNISSWITTENVSTAAVIALYEDFNWDYFKANLSVPLPYYAIYYISLPSVGYGVFFTYFQNDQEAPILFWNGTALTSDETDAISIGYTTLKSIVAFVPSEIFTILDNSTYIAQSAYIEFLNGILYTDIAPEKFNLFRETEPTIISYNLLFIISVLLGITLILIKKTGNKRKLEKSY
jgi:hypothetical protein